VHKESLNTHKTKSFALVGGGSLFIFLKTEDSVGQKAEGWRNFHLREQERVGAYVSNTYSHASYTLSLS
jgi:hypothetical protein